MEIVMQGGPGGGGPSCPEDNPTCLSGGGNANRDTAIGALLVLLLIFMSAYFYHNKYEPEPGRDVQLEGVEK